jgi:hypothetical protein
MTLEEIKKELESKRLDVKAKGIDYARAMYKLSCIQQDYCEAVISSLENKDYKSLDKL